MLGKKLEERVEDCKKPQAPQAEKACAEDFHSDWQSASRRKYSNDSCIVRLQVHQKTSRCCFPARPCWSQKPFTLKMEKDNFLSQMSCPDNRPESSDYSFCCFLCSQMWGEDTFIHLCTKDKRNKGGSRVFPSSLSCMLVWGCFFKSSTFLRLPISLPVKFSANKLSHFFNPILNDCKLIWLYKYLHSDLHMHMQCK